MGIIKAIIITFSMFSKIPMPKVKWEEKNMRYAISFLPLVSIPMGVLVWLWIMLSRYLNFDGFFLYAVGLTAIPVAVTGAIHMDGFADTVDAISSRAPIERKREILKDPHTGAFAIIGISMYFLIYTGLTSLLHADNDTLYCLCLCYFGSRVTGSLATLFFPSSASEGLLQTFKSASHKGSLVMIFILALAFCVWALIFDVTVGISMILICALCLLYIFVMSKRQFGGMSGDLAGYIIQICEVLLIAVAVIVFRLEVYL